VAARVPAAAQWAAALRDLAQAKLAEHKRYIAGHGIDLPEVRGWAWQRKGDAPVGSAARDTAADQQ
jgi:xylulose-5-phosphate/fructose-6-phosphate phosphoketolase